MSSTYHLSHQQIVTTYRSKLAAAILGGVDKIHIAPGKKVLYLGAASGTSVSHVSDIVGPVSLAAVDKFGFRLGQFWDTAWEFCLPLAWVLNSAFS